MSNAYDVLIIGGGPAGLAAGLYASRSKLNTILLETNSQLGGQVSTYHEMENYPGVLDTTAPELMDNFKEHAKSFGTKIEKAEVQEVETGDFIKTIKTKDGIKYQAKSVIVATGAEPRRLGVPGEEEFKGKGVSYCATCDADFFVDLEVVVVGNGNSAIEEALYLTKFASKVTVIVIHDQGTMDADKIYQERAYQNDKIEFVWNSTLEEVKGEGLVDTAVLKNVKTGEKTDFSCDGIFIFIGRVPRTDFLEGIVDLTDNGYIKTNDKLETSVPGVYAAGDVRNKFLRQVVTAAADGATTAAAAGGYIEEEEYWQENVLEAEEDVLVAFWSPTNEESLKMTGKLENMDLEAKGVKLVKIDTYKNTRISNRYDVTEVPTLLKIEDGEVAEKITQPTETEIEELI
ncbi:thioredoxin-disulfide reductase [Halobacteroides halobius DSM 5150]|uniref:Thioredoxin reductase n=1 Tax=Halobacteroides halobius (strain ATCC 35273 / DSM 5150 / MD-1) TaxID=748449 RepID=L0KAN3_HALHC|nr:thioredoxin-disulfide reductase [Halobacteroides halobius]AGB42076.1 thioredoxin-disulfide reductase [Halobacteroides halobius DSM 5150]